MAEIEGRINNVNDETVEDESMEENQDGDMDIDEEKIVIKMEKGDIEVEQEPAESLENVVVKEEKVDIEEIKIKDQVIPMDTDDSEPIEIIEPLPRKIGIVCKMIFFK